VTLVRHSKQVLHDRGQTVMAAFAAETAMADSWLPAVSVTGARRIRDGLAETHDVPTWVFGVATCYNL